MPLQPSTTQMRLNNITLSLSATTNTLALLSDQLDAPFLVAISNTTQSLVKCAQNVKQNKNDCTQLLEHTYQLLTTIMALHVRPDMAGDFPPNVLSQIGRFTETLHKIYTFVEAQQSGSKLKKFFRQGEMNTLLKDCKMGLQQALDFFEIKTTDIMTDLTEMQQKAHERHQKVLQMIEALTDDTSSGRGSSVGFYLGSFASSNSISMLPSEPKIFHGRETEITAVLTAFSDQAPRVAILGAGGMGKTSIARAVLHHTDIIAKFGHHRFFITCDPATNKVELAALIGTYLGLKPGRDLGRVVIQHFSTSPPALLILDNLETAWEPTESRKEVEEFLSLLTDINHLALMITMRGAERPAKVQWTRPFIPPLQPLTADAARKVFLDIADDSHNPQEISQILGLTDNMPLMINLLAHLVDVEGCSNVLSRWELEKTSLLSEGNDRRSNLDLSISISLSSPRIASEPDSKALLSLLSLLPDGLSDVELLQSALPIRDIPRCKATLIRTSLAYIDEHKRLKSLVPIREYMQKAGAPRDDLIRPLLAYFQALLEIYSTRLSSHALGRISSNYSNIQNVLQHGLKPDHPDLKNSIYCTCLFNSFSRLMNREQPPLMERIHDILPQPCDHRLEAYFITELFSSWKYSSVPNSETLISRALEHFDHIDDSDLKCKLYLSLTYYYTIYHQDSSAALKFSQTCLSLATSIANTTRQCEALYCMASSKWDQDDYSAAQQHAYESRRLASISADLYREAQALELEAVCWYRLGNYTESISLCNRARELLRLFGISAGHLDHHIMNTQAEVHRLKSEYIEAHNIQTGILQELSADQDPHGHGLTLHNLAQIDVQIDAPKADVQRNIDAARSIFIRLGHVGKTVMCDVQQAELNLREGDVLGAKILFQESVKISWGKDSENVANCLEKLGDTSCWGPMHEMSSWTIVLLVHALKSKEKLGIYKALQFLGDAFLSWGDEETTISLFTVALEGFTYMDVHRSRAECMLWLGDIAIGHHDPLRATELWNNARPLFERSVQAKRVHDIDERLGRLRSA